MSSLPEDEQSAIHPSSEEEENYYAAIERHFVSLRGGPLFITPREWQLIHDWHQRQIPLRVVKDGLERAMERPKSSGRTRNLAYCRQAVEAAYRRSCEALAGSEPPVDEREQVSMVRVHLRNLEERMRETVDELRTSRPIMTQAVGKTAQRLSFLSSGPLRVDTLPELERALSGLEEKLLRELEPALEEDEHRQLRDEAERSLARYRSRMPDEVYRSAAQSAYLKRVREKLGIPPLSLFCL